MALSFLYRKNGGQVLGVTTVEVPYPGINGTYFGIVTSPALPDGDNLSPAKIAVGSPVDTVRNATAPEQAAWPAAEAADDNLIARTEAILQFEGKLSDAKSRRVMIDVILDEINALRGMIVGVGSATWDPANMANAAGVTSPAMAVTNAAFGDHVDVAAPYSLQGIVATGFVSSAGNVMIRLHNSTGGAINLASGTWNVTVRRHVAMAARTMAQARNAYNNRINAGTLDDTIP